MSAIPRILFGVVAATGFLPMIFGQIELRPSDELFALACQNIKVNQQELRQRDFHLRLDGQKAAIHGPFSDLRKRKLDKEYTVDVAAYLNYLNAHLLSKQGRVFEIGEIIIEIGHGGVTAEDAPVFSVKMTGTDASGRAVTVEKAAIGPAYSVFKVHSSSDPVAVRSANIACFAAFLRAMLALDEKLGGTPSRN
jgi:hypothetical protein